MKKRLLNSLCATAAILLLHSCSSDGGNSNTPTPLPSTENSWKMNDYNFSRRASIQTSTTYTNGRPFTQVNVDSNISNSNNNFKSCNVIFWFNTSLTGVYSVKSENTVVSFDNLNYMTISCFVSDGAGHGAMYKSIDSDITATVTKVNDKFVVTVPTGITLTKTLDDGLVNAPVTMTFKSNKVH